MRRNQNSNNKSKNADKGKDKHQTLDTSDLLIESRLIGTSQQYGNRSAPMTSFIASSGLLYRRQLRPRG
jgi:hypothetical protein